MLEDKFTNIDFKSISKIVEIEKDRFSPMVNHGHVFLNPINTFDEYLGIRSKYGCGSRLLKLYTKEEALDILVDGMQDAEKEYYLKLGVKLVPIEKSEIVIEYLNDIKENKNNTSI